MTSGRKDPIVESCLEGNDIEYIDMRPQFEKNAGYDFPHDNHFTPKAAGLIGSQLIPLLDSRAPAE